MLKGKSKLLLWIVSVVCLLAAAYGFANVFLLPKLTNYLSAATGINITARSVSPSILKLGLSVRGVSVEGIGGADRITVGINPFKAVLSIKEPLKYIRIVELVNAKLNLDGLPAGSGGSDFSLISYLPEKNIRVLANSFVFVSSNSAVEISDIDLSVAKDFIVVNASAFGLSLNSVLQHSNAAVYDAVSSITSKTDNKFFARLKGLVNLQSFDFNQKINIKTVSYGGFSLTNSSGTAVKENSKFDANISGAFGKVSVASKDFKIFAGSGNIILSEFNKNFVSNLKFDFTAGEGLISASAKIIDLKIYNFLVGSYSVFAVRDKDGSVKAAVNYGAGKNLNVSLRDNGRYSVEFIINSSKAGSMSGNFKTGEFVSDINNIALQSMPIAGAAIPDVKGLLSVNGKIGQDGGKVEIAVKKYSSRNIQQTDMYGLLTKDGDRFVLNFADTNKAVSLNAEIKSKVLELFDLVFKKLEIAAVLKVIGYDRGNITGISSGHIKYAKDSGTEFDIAANDGMLLDNNYKTFNAKGDFNFSRINIEKLSAVNAAGQGIVDLTGFIGWTKKDPDSWFKIIFNGIKISGLTLTGDLAFKGNLISEGEVKGKVFSDVITISGFPVNKLSADALISLNNLAISNLKSANGVSGAFKADLDQNIISGNLDLKGINISPLTSELFGLADASAKINGSLDSPEIAVTAKIKNGKYKNVPFSLTAALNYADRVLNINSADIVSDKTKISLKGAYSAESGIFVAFNNLTESVLSSLIGYKLPLTGNFSGEGKIFQYSGKPKISASVTSRSIMLDGIKISEFKSDAAFFDNTVSLSSAQVKIADSEIRIDKASFDVKEGNFNFDIFLVNLHAGPADIFGGISISGNARDEKENYLHSGNIVFSNLWINSYKLSNMSFHYFVRDNNIRFVQLKNTGSAAFSSGSVTFGENKTEIKDFVISNDSMFFKMNAQIASDEVNLSASGNNLDWEFITSAFNLPVTMAGKMDLSLNFAGKFTNPKADLVINSANGSIMDVPFETLNIEMALSNNSAEIKRAKIFKKNEINVLISGYFPLFLDAKLGEKYKNAPVNINYEIEDSRMSVLKYITNGWLNPLAGNLFFKGSIKGPHNKLNSNGQLTITNGKIEAKNYFTQIKDFSADITLTDNLVKFNKFSFKSGKGKVSVSGDILLNGFSPDRFNLKMFTDDKGSSLTVMELPIPGAMGSEIIVKNYTLSEPKFELTLKGDVKEPELSGWAVLENTTFSYPPPEKPKGAEGGSSLIPPNTKLNIELRTGKNTVFANSFAQAWVNGTLTLTGTYSAVKANGSISSQQGNISYFRVTFDLVSAKLEVIDGVGVFLAGEATTEIYTPGINESETMVMYVDRSELKDLNFRFVSKNDPTLDSKIVLARIIGTDDTDTTNVNPVTGASDYTLRRQAVRLINSGFATPLMRDVLRKTGLIDNVKVSYLPQDDPIIYTPEADTGILNLLYGSKYSFEKNITDQLLVGYSVILDQINQQLDLRHEVEMRYRLTDTLFLSGIYELGNEMQLKQPDRRFMLQHQIRFGAPSKKD